MQIASYSKIDEILCKITYKLSSIPCLPLNHQQERERFFRSNTYNPVFTYNKCDNLDNIRELLLDIKTNNDEIGCIFKKKTEELLMIIEMMASVGTRKLTDISKSLYGVPDKRLVSKAWKLIAINDAQENVFLSSRQVAVRLKNAINKYGFTWEVKEREMAAKACVSTTDKILYIKKDCFYTAKFLKRLIVHEIGTHILRYENGSKQPYKLFSLGLKDYISTEEGLAVVNEEIHNCLTRSTLKTYAARVIAVDKAQKCSFREVYNSIVPFVGKDNAFDITLRVKRGLGNTMWPGAFTKDHIYLKGYFDVKDFLNAGRDMRKLYYGKVALQDIDNVEHVAGVIDPLFFSTMKYYTDHMQYKRPGLR